MTQVGEIFGIRSRGGLHLRQARLWLDAGAGLRLPPPPRTAVTFQAQHDGVRRPPARLLCSTTLAALLGTTRPPLAIPYGKPFQLGLQAIELLPAGSSPGSAMLRTQVGDRTVLFAGAARLDTLPGATPLEWREADVVVVDAELAATALANLDTLTQAVDRAVVEAANGRPVLWRVEQPTVALAVLALVAGRVPVRLAPTLQQLWRRSVAAGVLLPLPGSVRRAVAKPRMAQGRASLWLWPVAGALPAELQGLPTTLVAEDVAPQAMTAANAAQGLGFSRRASGEAVDAIALASGAVDVVAVGRGAAALALRLQAHGLRCWQLQDPQLALRLA